MAKLLLRTFLAVAIVRAGGGDVIIISRLIGYSDAQLSDVVLLKKITPRVER